ncbi:MAG: hypothetical protein R3D82_01435 [Xanthobacteraceae bacterium]
MLTEAQIDAHAGRIRDDGYTVIEGAASTTLVDGLKGAIDRIEREHNLGYARTSFEGFKTVRINNLLTYDDIFWEVPLHENVLPDRRTRAGPGMSAVLLLLAGSRTRPGSAADPRGHAADTAAAAAYAHRAQCDLGAVRFQGQ